jgi:hypothetical protein
MKDYVKVEGHPDLVKDTRSGALLNTDVNALEAYKKRKQTLQQTEARLDRLESDVGEIKDLLKELIGKFK